MEKVDDDELSRELSEKIQSSGAQNEPRLRMQVFMLYQLHHFNVYQCRLRLYSIPVMVLFLVLFFRADKFRSIPFKSHALSKLSECSHPIGQTIIVEGNNFRDLADATTALPLEVTQIEMLMADMRAMIQFRNIETRVMMPPELECILEVKNATRGLQRLTSKIGGTVDRCVHELFHACLSQRLAYSVIVVQAFVSDKLDGTRVHRVFPWLMSVIRREPFQDSVGTKIFEQVLGYFLRHLERLISEIDISNGKLLKLEACLTSIEDLISPENFTMRSARTSLLRNIWLKIRGNRKEQQKYDSGLVLLKDLGAYHRQASRHVAAVLKTLREAKHGIEEIRGRCERHVTQSNADMFIPDVSS